MTEVRREAWPNFESIEYSEEMFLHGIAGNLELFHLSIMRFQSVVGEPRGIPSPFTSGSTRPEITDRRADPRRHRHADGVWPRPADFGFDQFLV